MQQAPFQNVFAHYLTEYKSMYASSDYDTSFMRIGDQIFNTIGNGIRDREEFLEQFNLELCNSDQYDQKLISDEKMYYLYKVGFDNPREFCSEENYLGTFSESELQNVPHGYKMEIKQFEFNPYPNFQKQYSLVWEEWFNDVADQTWVDAAIKFYTNCKEWFTTDAVVEYHSHPSKCKNSDYESGFARYRKEGMTDQEFYDIISKEWGSPFDGDVDKFKQIKFERDLARINLFIDETSKMLKNT